MGADRKKAYGVGPVKEDLAMFPEGVKKRIGFDIGILQEGDMPEQSRAKQMRGFNPPVIELRASDGDSAYRCVVTVRLKHRVYILHAFKKKSTKDDETPQREIEIIAERLKWALRIDADFDLGEQTEHRRGA